MKNLLAITLLSMSFTAYADKDYKYSETITIDNAWTRYSDGSIGQFVKEIHVFKHDSFSTGRFEGTIDGVKVCGNAVDISLSNHVFYRFHAVSCKGEEGHNVLFSIEGRLEYIPELDIYLSPESRPLSGSIFQHSDETMISYGLFLASSNNLP